MVKVRYDMKEGKGRGRAKEEDKHGRKEEGRSERGRKIIKVGQEGLEEGRREGKRRG